jgi:hypothetical protein
MSRSIVSSRASDLCGISVECRGPRPSNHDFLAPDPELGSALHNVGLADVSMHGQHEPFLIGMLASMIL